MKTYKELVELLEKNKNILAVGIGGSLGLGYLDEYSDIDLFLISKDSYSIPKLMKELKKEDFDFHPYPEILKNLNSFSLRTKDRRIDIQLLENKNFKKECMNVVSFIREERGLTSLLEEESLP